MRPQRRPGTVKEDSELVSEATATGMLMSTRNCDLRDSMGHGYVVVGSSEISASPLALSDVTVLGFKKRVGIYDSRTHIRYE
jgi:hypothetical protein